MFEIGWGEVVVVLVVSLWVLGPEKMPAVIKMMGFYAGRAQKTFSALKNEFQREWQRACDVPDKPTEP